MASDMKSFELNSEIIGKYRDYLDIDAVENLENDVFRGIIIVDGDLPLAAMIWELHDGYNDELDTSASIEWIKVSDMEAGKELLRSYSSASGWDHVMSTRAEIPIDDDLLVNLFKNSGYTLREAESSIVTITLRDLRTIPVAKNLKYPDYIKSLGNISPRIFRRGILDCLYNVKRDFPDILSSIPLEWFDMNISCFNETDGESKGFFLFHKCPSGRIRVELLADWGPDAQRNMLYMFKYALRKAFLIYTIDTEIIVRQRDMASKMLTKYFFPTATDKMSLICELNREE